MSFTASDVMKLRAETDAPMMECKAALTEAEGDFERAKSILREKGKAAAAKRADRATGAGVVAVAKDENGIAAIVVECETDFVAINPEFKAAAQRMAEMILKDAPEGVSLEDALNKYGLGAICEELVGSIRENIQVKKVVKFSGSQFGYYVHHDNKTAAIVELTGKNDEVSKEIGIQVVSMHPEVVNREDLPQERLAKEMETETRRAIEEGKPEEMAKKIAEGRVNKEFIKSAALLEQPFFRDQGLTVGQYVKDTGGGVGVVRFIKLAVGQ